MKVLIFAPHPDDEVIGCGGSILKHVAHGDEVNIVCLTSGERAMSFLSVEENRTNREQEAKDAGSVLRVAKYHFLRFRDTFMEPDENSVKVVAQLTQKLQPDWVYITHEHEVLHDHATAYRLVTKALAIASRQSRLGPPSLPNRVLAYEVWSPIHSPNYVVDITRYIEQKLEALRMYKVELMSRPYDQIAEALSRYRGLTLTSGTYAEAFSIVNLRE